jgi:hypothetical protein
MLRLMAVWWMVDGSCGNAASPPFAFVLCPCLLPLLSPLPSRVGSEKTFAVTGALLKELAVLLPDMAEVKE